MTCKSCLNRPRMQRDPLRSSLHKSFDCNMSVLELHKWLSNIAQTELFNILPTERNLYAVESLISNVDGKMLCSGWMNNLYKNTYFESTSRKIIDQKHIFLQKSLKIEKLGHRVKLMKLIFSAIKRRQEKK